MAPYVTDVLNHVLQEVPVNSLSFDESYNLVLKKSQIDLLIRYWDERADMVSTRYYDSTCLGKAAATDVFENFNDVAKNLEETKFLQVMSDGRNVNKPFLNLLAETMEEEQHSRLVNLGTCGLHTLHNGFQHGKKASGWELKLFNSMYKIFDESPARRAGYEFTTAIESDFALQFCSHRWIENARVAEKAENIWKNTYKLLIFGKLCQKGNNQAKASLKLTRVLILCLKKQVNCSYP